MSCKLLKKCIFSLSLMVAFVIATMGLSITAFADDTYSVPIENNINWTIVANTSRTGTEQLNLCKGDILKYNVSFTPTTGSNVKFGLITPSGTFRYVSLSSGTCLASFSITEDGIHKIKISNASDISIKVNGIYFTGWHYMFHNTTLSKITESFPTYSNGNPHNGVDIIGQEFGVIANQPVYGVSSGTVVNKAYSSTAGNYVKILLNSDYYVRYLHLNEPASVSAQQTITYNTLIGYVGRTGSCYPKPHQNSYCNKDSSSCEAPSYCKKCGYHLHFDVTNPDGDYVQPLDFFPHISFT